MAPLHASHANKKMPVGTMHKFALNKPPPVATWAISRQNAHNDAPQVERRRGPRALQILPTVEEALQDLLRSGHQYPAYRFYERPYGSISDVRYALESP